MDQGTIKFKILAISLLITIFSTYSDNLFSQGKEDSLILISKYKNNSILLRWASTSPFSWQTSLLSGYKLSRANYEEGIDKVNLKYIPLTKDPIKKWTLDQWNKFASQNKFNEKVDSVKYAFLAWEISKNDIHLNGNENIEEIMKFRKSLEMKHTFGLVAADQSWVGALVQGLAFTDKNIELDKKYVYKLEYADKSLSIEPAYLTVFANNNSQITKSSIHVLEFDKSLTISWSSKILSSGYHIQISEDGNKFIKINNTPYYPVNMNKANNSDTISFKIDNLINDKLYYCKVYGTTPFAERFLIGEAKGKPRDLTPPNNPIIIEVKHIAPQKVRIKWEINDPINSDLNGFIIGRGSNYVGPFEQIHNNIIAKESREYLDIDFSDTAENYYVIEAIDISGNRSRSNFAHLSLVDSISPETPLCIKSKMDSLGIVTLQLEPQVEKDFMGYRIYKANADDHEFSVVQETYNDTIVELARKPIITDTSTVKSLTKYIYYKVTALDYHYNESKPSEMIKVKRPDIYPPVAPVIHDFLVTDSLIRIDFIPSSSSDVVRHFMMRKKSSEENWSILDTLGVNQHTYFDKSTITNISYDYAIRAQDDSDLFSPLSNVLTLKTYRKSRPAKIDITCAYDTNAKTTTITWVLKEKIQDMTQLQIYDISKNTAYINSISPENEGKYTFPSPQIINKVGLKLLTGDFDFLISESNNCKILK